MDANRQQGFSIIEEMVAITLAALLLALGAPSFVTEPPGEQIKADPARLEIFKDYVRNIAIWLKPATNLSVAA